MRESNNPYDWLGPGRYFWEGNLERALDFAEELRKRGKIKTVSAVGAVINLGFCLDFVESRYLVLLKPAYESLVKNARAAGVDMPENKPEASGGDDLLLRYLDRAVIQMIHQERAERKEPPFDSVRGVFWEGDPPYPNAGFRAKNHVQICVRNPNCLKRFFRPRTNDPKWALP